MFMKQFLFNCFLHICEYKGAVQMHSSHAADQRLFSYTDSIIPQLPKSKISSVKSSSVVVQPGLCRTWSNTQKTSFLVIRLMLLRDPARQLGCLIQNQKVLLILKRVGRNRSHDSYDMSLVVRKPIFRVSDQLRHKPGCMATEDG